MEITGIDIACFCFAGFLIWAAIYYVLNKWGNPKNNKERK